MKVQTGVASKQTSYKHTEHSAVRSLKTQTIELDKEQIRNQAETLNNKNVTNLLTAH
jgi:hypothetical protein